jgi:2-methylcitrate dehydratase PrpD
MSDHETESKRLLSHTIAEWACSKVRASLSPAAIQAAKLFWFDSISCALGGSQQDDARILLSDYRAMSGTRATSTRLLVRSLSLPATGTFWSARRLQNQIS